MGYPSAGPWGRPGGISGSHESMGLSWAIQAVRSDTHRSFLDQSGSLMQGDTLALSQPCKCLTQGVPAHLGRNDCASESEGDKRDLAAEIRGSRAKWVTGEHSFCPEPASRGPEDIVSWGLFPGEGGEGGSSRSAGRPERGTALCTSLPLAGPGPPREDSFPCGCPCPHPPAGTLPSLPQWEMDMPIPGGGEGGRTRCTSSS